MILTHRNNQNQTRSGSRLCYRVLTTWARIQICGMVSAEQVENMTSRWDGGVAHIPYVLRPLLETDKIIYINDRHLKEPSSL